MRAPLPPVSPHDFRHQVSFFGGDHMRGAGVEQRPLLRRRARQGDGGCPGIIGDLYHVTWPGDYHYLANSVIEAGKTGIPLLNDVPDHLPVPGLEPTTPHNDAKILSTILAIECTTLVLPPMPILRPEHLMEFRAENAKALRTFRRSMLQYAGDLNGKIKGVSPADFQQTTKFFIQTEIIPVLDALRSSLSDPRRPWLGAKFLGDGPGNSNCQSTRKICRRPWDRADRERRPAYQSSAQWPLLPAESSALPREASAIAFPRRIGGKIGGAALIFS
jgi:hypothetical protein